MGWLDKLLGRDKESAGEAAGSTGMQEESGSQEAARMAEDHASHEGHDHAPGEHPHEENA